MGGAVQQLLHEVGAVQELLQEEDDLQKFFKKDNIILQELLQEVGV